ncbi:NAD(P)/FAD-dependent oxidoreductase [Mycobacterium sp. BMJ-28]
MAIIGGGSIGSATAWHLLESAPEMSVVVIEPDPSYHLAATSVASGGVRQLFSRPENVRLSQYTHEVIEAWDGWPAGRDVAGADVAPATGWRPNGYLFIAAHTSASSRQLETDYAQQRALGVDAMWLEPNQIHDRYPHLRVDDLGPGILSPRDGWLDPHAFLHGMRARARHLGASFVTDKVVGFEVRGQHVEALQLESGERLRATAVVNTAGVWGPALSGQLGLQLPVEPMRRFDHYVETPADFTGYPFIKDPSGLAVRPEGAGLTAALVDFSHPGGHDLSIDPTYFESVVWPALVQRFPVLDALKPVSTWAGLYDQNRFDGNMIIDRWTGHLDNFYFATGFSGHGLMHAPGVGRALTELIVHGKYRSIDLSRFGLDRILTGTPYAELAIR